MRQLGRIARRAQLAATRRPPPPRWLRPALTCLVVVLTIGATLAFAVRFEAPRRAADWSATRLLALAEGAGFQAREVLVTGRKRTSAVDIIQIVDSIYDKNIFSVDLTRLQAEVEVLPWVKSATVKRQLPATLVVAIDEHRPLALWQGADDVRLVSEVGDAVSVPDALAQDRLPLLTGDGAPEAAPALFALLNAEPSLAARVSAAHRLTNGRWNVFVDGAVEVRLPQDTPLKAWRRLAKEEAVSGVLDRAIRAIDLRAGTWLVLKLHEAVLTPAGQPA